MTQVCFQSHTSAPRPLNTCWPSNSSAFSVKVFFLLGMWQLAERSLPFLYFFFALCPRSGFAAPARSPSLKACCLCPRWTGTCTLSARSRALSNGLWKKVRVGGGGQAMVIYWVHLCNGKAWDPTGAFDTLKIRFLFKGENQIIIVNNNTLCTKTRMLHCLFFVLFLSLFFCPSVVRVSSFRIRPACDAFPLMYY